MMVWPLINVAAGLIVAAVLAYRLLCDPDTLTSWERYGAGLTGAGMILTIGPILFIEPTPFEDWGGTLIRIGNAVFFLGQLLRHRHNNAAAKRQARRHLEGRG